MTATETNGSGKAARTFPAGFALGRRNGRLPNRGRRPRRRTRPIGLGHLQPHPRQGPRRRHRRYRLRLLPPLRGRSRPLRALGLQPSGSPSRGRGSSRQARRRNQAGPDFYRTLVDALHAREIAPAITLFHWDLPQALEDAGGWANRDTAQRFAESRRSSPPRSPTTARLDDHQRAPGRREPGLPPRHPRAGHADDALAAAATHHLLLGHALALVALRATLPAAAIGIALDIHPVSAFDEGAEEARAVTDAEQNRIFLDPILHGRYPATARVHMLPPAALIHDGDMELITAPLDFLGVNYYSPHYVKRAGGRAPAAEAPGAGRPAWSCAGPRASAHSMGWLIEPDGLYDILMLARRGDAARLPLYITENGCAAEDYVNPEGAVEDSSASSTCAGISTRPGGHPRRRQPRRLLPLVAAGQLRVGLGLPEALRPGLPGLRDPAADTEAQRRALPPSRDEQRVARANTTSLNTRRIGSLVEGQASGSRGRGLSVAVLVVDAVGSAGQHRASGSVR